ncbi:hypothetical protein [Thalassolituus sp.]|uniref:hypothetical protein n=1 Tax=Thalassolituus sp. TaxID=2030822 RepID=UPI003516A2D3
MNSTTLNNAAKNAGFSKGIQKAGNQYVLLDKDTDGRVGRAIFIKSDLIRKFSGFDSQADLDEAFSRIKQLRATAGGIDSFTNVANPKEHMGIIGRAKIKYKIFQYASDEAKAPGVYITDVDLADFSRDSKPGVYDIERNADGSWRSGTTCNLEVKRSYAAVNGLCENLKQASENIIPPMLVNAYSNKDAREKINNYSMFYNPPYLQKGATRWKTPAQKTTTLEIASARLQHVLKKAAKEEKEVSWVIHGSGIDVFHKAISGIKQTNLSNHTVIFMAPTSPVADVLPAIRSTNIQLHSNVMKIHPHDQKSRETQLMSGDSLKQQLEAMGHRDEGILLHRERRQDLVNMASSVSGVATMGIGGVALTLPATGFGIAALAIGGILSMHKGIQTAHMARNISANGLTNEAFNPHLNPHMTVAELNLTAEKASGSLAKTFYDVIKMKLKS